MVRGSLGVPERHQDTLGKTWLIQESYKPNTFVLTFEKHFFSKKKKKKQNINKKYTTLTSFFLYLKIECEIKY